MAIKELQTRIALKYDSYAKWTTAPGKDLQLLPGELGICEIESVNTHSNVAPTVLFKVGGATYPAGHAKAGQLMTFEDLPWASAKAADVYSWAKASDVTLVVTEVDGKASTKEIEFVGTGKKITLDYLTEKEVKAITDSLAARIVAVENAVNGTEGVTGIKASIEALDGRLDTLEGDGAGSVKKALADAKAYADQAEADALAAAKTYADEKAAANAEDVGDVAADLSEHLNAANPHNITAATLNLDKVDNKSVATIKTEFTGEIASGNTGFATGGAVHTAIEAAKTAAATTAQGKVDALANGQVKTNTDNIAENAAAIARVEGAYKEADKNIDDRLKKVETFFEGAAEDGKNGVQEALDTLVEIQDFINTEGTTAQKIVNDIATNTTNIGKNTTAIADLQAIVNLEDGATSGGLKTMQSDIATNKSNIATLQSIVKGYSDEGSIKSAVDKAQSDATKAIGAAGQAQADATDAQNRIGVIEGKVNHATSGLEKTYEIASKNASDVSDLKDLTKDYATVVQNVTGLKAIVETGDNSNAKLRSDIGTIQSIVNGTNGNSALAARIKTVEDAVNHADTGLNALNTTVGDHAGRIAAIESDYLKAADQLIFLCGDSASNTFVVPTN